MAPDLDIFIQSPSDPLLFLEFHRQFTHSLFFIPIGALIVAGVLYRFVREKLNFREAYFAALAGYATHALLDACTTYGTQLFWPITDYRVAWNNVSVVDPLFTLPLLILVIVGAVRRAPKFAVAGLVWALSYLLLGVVQNHRATDAAIALIESRGHTPHRLSLKPGFANLILWKSVYEHDGRYYVDAVRVLGDSTICEGESVVKLDVAYHLPDLSPTSQQATDIERFRWFSSDYLAWTGNGSIIDMRYSMLPDEVDGMWGIRVNPKLPEDAHIFWWSERNVTPAKRGKLADMLMGRLCTPLP